MSKHTPGPWLHRAKSNSVHRPPPHEPYQYGDTIFQFDYEEGPNDADLALILAAPDLLEALKLAERYCPVNSEAEILARAAIAKAEGEQHGTR